MLNWIKRQLGLAKQPPTRITPVVFTPEPERCVVPPQLAPKKVPTSRKPRPATTTPMPKKMPRQKPGSQTNCASAVDDGSITAHLLTPYHVTLDSASSSSSHSSSWSDNYSSSSSSSSCDSSSGGGGGGGCD